MTMAVSREYAAIKQKLGHGEVIILDGAIGTEILRRDVTWADHQLKSRPDVVRTIHEDYVLAGADVISTNTFQLSRRALLGHFRNEAHMQHIGAPDLPGRWAELVRAGVRLAREARERAAGDRPVAVAGAMTTLEWCFRPDLAPDDEQANAEYGELIQAFVDAGCDLILLETMNSVREAAIAARAARAIGIPVWVSFVCDERGRLFTGETMRQVAEALEPLGPDAILLNCAPPQDIAAGLQDLAQHATVPLGAYPHVGRFDPPEWLFTDEYPPPEYLRAAQDWINLGARIVGGCCGTTPDHIAALRQALGRGS